MSEIAILTDRIDKLSELIERVAVVIVRQDAHESAMDEIKDDVKTIKSEMSQLRIDVAVAKESSENHEKQAERTSSQIASAIKWGAGIAGTLIVGGVMGSISMFIKLS